MGHDDAQTERQAKSDERLRFRSTAQTRVDIVAADRLRTLEGTKLIRREKSEHAFLRLQEAAADWPCFFRPYFTAPGRVFYPTLEDGTHVDDSFALARRDTASLLAECNVIGDTLGRFGGPLELRFSPASNYSEVRYDAAQAFSELKRIAKERKAAKILLRTCIRNDPYGVVASRALAANATPHVETRAEVDLLLSEDEILLDMRTSHRQQLQWGRTNLSIDAVTSACPDRSKFDLYQMFHVETAGRATRPMAAWDAMFAWIQDDVGELLIGMKGDELLAGGLSLDAMDCAYYLSGVYHRAYFKNPVAHFLVYSMLMRAKRRGMRFFDVGVVHASNEDVSEKERAISHFKHGFTSRTVNSTIWTMTISE